jgi:hypothetical protein
VKKADVAPNVRLGLESIVQMAPSAIRTMLSASAHDSLVEKLVDCMGMVRQLPVQALPLQGALVLTTFTWPPV